MIYNNKEVWTRETFSYSAVQIGDFVEQAVVDDAMDCLPPACMTGSCSQMGEPYSHRLDPKTGRWRATYATFKRRPDAKTIWEYRGHCFRVRMWSGAGSRCSAPHRRNEHGAKTHAVY